jgi:hypothetical protein
VSNIRKFGRLFNAFNGFQTVLSIVFALFTRFRRGLGMVWRMVDRFLAGRLPGDRAAKKRQFHPSAPICPHLRAEYASVRQSSADDGNRKTAGRFPGMFGLGYTKNEGVPLRVITGDPSCKGPTLPTGARRRVVMREGRGTRWHWLRSPAWARRRQPGQVGYPERPADDPALPRAVSSTSA